MATSQREREDELEPHSKDRQAKVKTYKDAISKHEKQREADLEEIEKFRAEAERSEVALKQQQVDRRRMTDELSSLKSRFNTRFEEFQGERRKDTSMEQEVDKFRKKADDAVDRAKVARQDLDFAITREKKLRDELGRLKEENFELARTVAEWKRKCEEQEQLVDMTKRGGNVSARRRELAALSEAGELCI